MNIDKGAAEAHRDRRFDNHKPRVRTWTFETGVSATYLSGESDLYPPGTVQHPEDDLTGCYVDFNMWPECGDDEGNFVSLLVPGQDQKLRYMPFPWHNPVIQKTQKNVRLQNEINGLVALESVHSVFYTPLLYLMLNGTPRGSTTAPAVQRPVVSSLDLMHCYHMVETLFTTNPAEWDAARIQKAKDQFASAIKKTKAAVKIALGNVPDGDAYAKRLFEHVREHNGDSNSLANLTDDQDVLTLIARIYISYQINYIHALEVYIIRLLLPSVDPEKLDRRYFTCPTMPAAHPDDLFKTEIDRLETEGLIDESLVLLRQRATQFKVNIMPRELNTEQRVCGAPAHFFRLLMLILTH